ncbi:diguanylate cyclase [Bacillus kwashiorkori]|uniref:sensor domain-containing diguanylate cyclase n=1 Tax=Bacillus kwashiorkori TaxID=1522318 RepID=UPI001319CE83|nr:diguanylate cyclase [Bacillus kwashiorkori]
MNRLFLISVTYFYLLFLQSSLNSNFIDIGLIAFIIITSLNFHHFGGLVASLIAIITLYFFHYDLQINSYVIYILIGLVSDQFFLYFMKKTEQAKFAFFSYVEQSKELSIYKEISTAMQQTLQLNKILHIILTAVTAGKGFGYNRALIFFLNESGDQFEGKIGIGPMNINEGFKVWERIISENFNLNELVIDKEVDIDFDNELNLLLHKVSLPYTSPIISQVFLKNTPIIIDENTELDTAIKTLKSNFDMTHFAIIPLVNQGKKVGLLVIDNIVNKKKIHMRDIEPIIPIATQAAIAIDHALLYEETERLSIIDGLTGLLNQRAMQNCLEETFSDQPLSIILLDIDNFKFYNDRNGHLLGNEVLIKVANILKQSENGKLKACRFGGEEFLIILPKTSLSTAYKIAEAIRANIEIASFPEESYQPTKALTVSVGVASTERSSIKTKDDLLECADRALYAAKAAGKNKVQIYKEVVSD